MASPELNPSLGPFEKEWYKFKSVSVCECVSITASLYVALFFALIYNNFGSEPRPSRVLFHLSQIVLASNVPVCFTRRMMMMMMMMMIIIMMRRMKRMVMMMMRRRRRKRIVMMMMMIMMVMIRTKQASRAEIGWSVFHLTKKKYS